MVPTAGFLHKQVSTAALNPDARSFKPGFIFGKDVIAEERMNSRIHLDWFGRMDRKSFAGGTMTGPYWEVWNTPLDRYLINPETGDLIFGKGTGINFKEHLIESARIAAEKGEVLRILDIGVGGGAQWADFLRDHEVIFHGTAISRWLVYPDNIKELVVLSSAANVSKHFTPGFFDIVVSNYGMHRQPNSAIESAMHVLKLGGELVLASESPGPLLKVHNASKMLDVIYEKKVATSLTHEDGGAYPYKWILRATKAKERPS